MKWNDALWTHMQDGKLEDWERKQLDEIAKRDNVPQRHRNLAFARMAIAAVRQKIPVAANWDIHDPNSYDYEHARTGRLDPTKRNAVDKCVYQDLRQTSDWVNIPKAPDPMDIDSLGDLEALAARTKCGNCLEMAAAAFMYLYRLGLRPLDYMAIYPRYLDHQFVVLGRTGDGDVSNWGAGAVVCDPWAVGLQRRRDGSTQSGQPFGDTFGVYPARFLGDKMIQMFPGFKEVELDFRKEEEKAKAKAK